MPDLGQQEGKGKSPILGEPKETLLGSRWRHNRQRLHKERKPDLGQGKGTKMESFALALQFASLFGIAAIWATLAGFALASI